MTPSRSSGRKWDAKDEPEHEIAYTPARVLMQDFTGVPGDRRPRRDARRDGGAGRRPREDQPARAGRARDRPLDPGRRVRRAARLQAQRRVRVRAQQGALRVPALGPGGVRQLRGRAAEHRHLPPGEPRVPRPRGRVARRPGVPRHAGRHRLAHHDDQRPRRARLGRRRHRGRGRDARPAGVDAAAAGRRLQADRRAARGLDRHRPRPDRHPDAARGRRGRASSSSSTAPACRTWRWPTARRSGTCRRRWARRARSSRSTRRRCATSSSPAARPSGSSWSRPTAGAGPLPRRGLRGGHLLRRRSSSTWATSSRPSPARSARRTACRCRRRRRTVRAELDEYMDGRAQTGYDEAVAESVPVERHAHEQRRRRVAEGGPQPPASPAPRWPSARQSFGRRLRRDRGDHELHEHVEPVGHARLRPARQEGRRARAQAQAVGEDVAWRRARRS